MSSRSKEKRIRRDIQGYMAICVFGCHCGETAEMHDFRGSFIMGHLRDKHPALYYMGMNPRLTFSVERK